MIQFKFLHGEVNHFHYTFALQQYRSVLQVLDAFTREQFCNPLALNITDTDRSQFHKIVIDQRCLEGKARDEFIRNVFFVVVEDDLRRTDAKKLRNQRVQLRTFHRNLVCPHLTLEHTRRMREIGLAPIEALSNSLEGGVGKNNSICALIELSKSSATDGWIAAFETHACQAMVSTNRRQAQGSHCAVNVKVVHLDSFTSCKLP